MATGDQMADCLTKALPSKAMPRQRDHVMGSVPVQYMIHGKIFRDNEDKFKNKSELQVGYFVHYAMWRHKF